MECEVSTSTNYENGGTGSCRSGTASTNSSTTPSGSSKFSSGSRTSSAGSAKSGLHVDFIENGEVVKERREKYLTAKYGSHQMTLIRKRLAVEMWLCDELQKLYENEGSSNTNGDGDQAPSSSPSSSAPEIELDEVLDMDGDAERRKYLHSLLIGATKPPEILNKFIDDVLEKAKTL